MYTKIFLLCLRKDIKKEKEVMEILEKQTKLNGSTEFKIEKYNKRDKSKRSSYGLVVFKHDCSLEIYLEFWRKITIPGHL